MSAHRAASPFVIALKREHFADGWWLRRAHIRDRIIIGRFGDPSSYFGVVLIALVAPSKHAHLFNEPSIKRYS